MKKQLLRCFLFTIFPFFGYSQPITQVAAPAGPLEGGTAATVAAIIQNATPNTSYSTTITCTGCTPDTKIITTNGSGFGSNSTFSVILP